MDGTANIKMLVRDFLAQISQNPTEFTAANLCSINLRTLAGVKSFKVD